MNSRFEELLDCLKIIVVPIFVNGNKKLPSPKDYEDYLSLIEEKLLIVDKHISLLTEPRCTSQPNVDDALALLTIFRGQHSITSAWTKNSSIDISSKWYESVCTAMAKWNRLSPLKDGKIVKMVFELLRPHLLKTTFKCHPADVICYQWLLQNVEDCILGDMLPTVLPTSLILCDDFETQNITIGLESLLVIIDGVAINLLTLYSYDEVILDSLKKCIFQGDVEVLSRQLLCYVVLMRKRLQYSKSLERNPFDGVIHTVLFNMYMETKQDKRLIYASHLDKLIEARGLGVVRHLSLIFKIVSEYTLDPITTTHTLRTLKTIVAVCWCRGNTIYENVSLVLLQLLVEMNHQPERFDDKVTLLACQLASLLGKLFPEPVDELKSKMRGSALDSNLVKLFDNIFCADATD